jgi:biopolymer transport protein TolR
MRATPATSLQSDINVTPLIDVCLVLLIVFMVITPLLVTGVPVHLPQTSTGDPLAKKPLQISVNADDTIYIDGVAVRGEQLTSELARKRDQLSRPVVVHADRALRYGDVIKVLDACRSAGFENVGLATTRQPTTDNAWRAATTPSADVQRGR